MSAAPLRNSALHGAVPTSAGSHSAAPLGNPRTAAPQRSRDHLRAVGAPQQSRSLVPFATLCVGIVIAALAAVLILNTTMARGAYESQSLRIEIANFHQQRAALLTQLEAASAPGGLAHSAQNLGMVPASHIGFVSIGTGAVLGSAG